MWVCGGIVTGDCVSVGTKVAKDDPGPTPLWAHFVQRHGKVLSVIGYAFTHTHSGRRC